MINNKKIIKYYEEELKAHGDNAMGMGWNDDDGQRLRFMILSQLKFTPGCSLLDVGCGLAHLWEFLIARDKDNTAINYSGIDISKRMAHGSKKKFPQLNFGAHDIFAIDYTTFDFVVCSGAFNTLLDHKESEWKAHCKTTIKKMFELSKIGVAFNMLSHYNPERDNDFYYASPEEYFSFAKTLTKSVTLRHDYPMHEFTIFMYKMGDLT